MTEPRRPVFWFLWSTPDPHAPLDGDYRQLRPVRITGRGPIRIATLVIATAVTVMFIATALLAAFIAPVLPAVLLSAAIGATACFLVLRGWVVGTFVSDEAVRVETVFGRKELAWSDVMRVETVPTRTPFLGVPIPVDGERVVLIRADGIPIATHVYTSSPDLWLRAEAFDIARLRVERWGDQG